MMGIGLNHHSSSKMNPWVLFSLIPGLSHLLLGSYVLYKGPKRHLNKAFTLFAFSLAIWSLSEFMHRLDVSSGSAYVWIRLGGFGWCYMASFCMHFVLVFARRERILKSKLAYIILYGPPSVILYLFLRTDLIYKQEPVRLYFGYTSVPGELVWLYTLNYMCLYAFVIYLFLEVMRKGIKLEKKQATPVFFGSTIFLSLSTATNIAFPRFGISAPELGTTLSIIWAISVFYAVIEHKLFIVEPSIEEPMLAPEKYSLESGIGYLVKEEKPDKGYEIFYDQITHGGFGLCITKFLPEKVRERYSLVKTPIVWSTFKNIENSISPKDVDGLSSLVSDFVRKTDKALIFLDCFDQIKFASGFEKSLSMLRDFKKLCNEHNSTILISVAPELFENHQLGDIEEELERVETE